MQIRHATPSDAEALRAIYAPYVEQTAITFELSASTAFPVTVTPLNPQPLRVHTSM